LIASATLNASIKYGRRHARREKSQITDSQTPAADHRLQRASHRGHLTDPDKEPTAAIGCLFSV
jgi:hypothetical protein